MILGIIIGIAVGFFFNPQIEGGLRKIAGHINKKKKHDDY